MSKAITDYWLKYYATNHCTLCGNSGIINSTGKATATGLVVGRKNFCICPNGQVMRKEFTKKGLTVEDVK